MHGVIEGAAVVVVVGQVTVAHDGVGGHGALVVLGVEKHTGHGVCVVVDVGARVVGGILTVVVVITSVGSRMSCPLSHSDDSSDGCTPQKSGMFCHGSSSEYFKYSRPPKTAPMQRKSAKTSAHSISKEN